MATVEFRSAAECREVLDRAFAMMDADPQMGPALRDAEVPQRFAFADRDLVVNVRGARDGESGTLRWVWTDAIDWEPRVRMSMSSAVANRYFQGRENVPIAIARRRIKAEGDVRAALAIIPITKPIFVRYRDMVATDYPHLKV
jgi:hypothetical protein